MKVVINKCFGGFGPCFIEARVQRDGEFIYVLCVSWMDSMPSYSSISYATPSGISTILSWPNWTWGSGETRDIDPEDALTPTELRESKALRDELEGM